MKNLQDCINDYFRARREGKPLLAAKAIAAAMDLPDQADVDVFTRRVRTDKGIQDLALISADRPYSVEVKEGEGDWKHHLNPVSADEVCLVAARADSFSISFPSVHSHWGYAVFYTAKGKEFRATSADYAMTETYMSM
jgi:hypothetical protein